MTFLSIEHELKSRRPLLTAITDGLSIVYILQTVIPIGGPDNLCINVRVWNVWDSIKYVDTSTDDSIWFTNPKHYVANQYSPTDRHQVHFKTL